jgi:hypothetical protein
MSASSPGGVFGERARISWLFFIAPSKFPLLIKSAKGFKSPH